MPTARGHRHDPGKGTMHPASAASDVPKTAEETEPQADAVCFAAGWKGAPFAAGVIHAYLAAGRPAPRLAAGISVGALSAAAMQRCYKELGDEESRGTEESEGKRWGWFRRYLRCLTDSPFDVLWRAFPDPVDLDSDMPPVHDLSCPPSLRDDEAKARRRYFLLIKLARWLARLPIRFSSFADLAVAHVRQRERYGGFRITRGLTFAGSAIRVFAGLVWHLISAPQFVNETSIRDAPPTRLRGINRIAHPLFGWRVWLAAIALPISALGILISFSTGVLLFANWTLPIDLSQLTGRLLAVFRHPTLTEPVITKAVSVTLALFTAAIFAILGYACGYFLLKRPRRFFTSLEIQNGLLSDYHLHRQLHELFAEESADSEPRIDSDPFPLVLVAAPLNQLEKELAVVPVGQQVWAGKGGRLVEALRAALAVPFLFPPLHVAGADVDDWLVVDPGQPKPSALDLVDGAAVRNNPIPAVVAFLRGPKNRALAKQLEGKDPKDCRLHLVSGIQIEPNTRNSTTPPSARMNIVEVAGLSLKLAQRRDIEMEREEVNFLSEVELNFFGSAPASDGTLLKVFVDEIAPTEDLIFKNPLAPEPQEILVAAATGCRRTLEQLYKQNLQELACHSPHPADSQIACEVLLRSLARKGGAMHVGGTTEQTPGLPEICSACSRKLAVSRKAPEKEPGFGLKKEEIPVQFAHLTGERPRICFLASGGVFRGATHIGVLGALRVAGIRPDLIVGASVGALIGGALGAISVLDDEPAFRLLGELATTFRKVDREVALTGRLKSAARQLGVRARRVKLSPANFQRMIERGTRSDPGFAATGAPPALVDAMSDLTLLPHHATRRIATAFVADHYVRAANLFFDQIQRETLRRLDIEYEVMGTSLLAPAAYRLLGGGTGIDLDRSQPFHRGPHPVSFFCTSSRLHDRAPLLLGRDFPIGGTAYDFVESVLSSSAFPSIFSPRREADVFPGYGNTDVLLADGGMFDNLPFYPSIEVLQEIQRSHGEHLPSKATGGFLKELYSQPVLFITAALDAEPPRETEHGYDDLVAIYRRSSQLKSNLKMLWFEATFEHLGRQLGRLADRAEEPAAEERETQEKKKFAEGIVPGGVLKIIPTDAAHINPTFAFCASTGLKPDRVNLAIADGCFQTFRAFAEAQAHSHNQETMVDRSLTVLQENQRIPNIELQENPGTADGQHCPFFRLGNGCLDHSFRCPFLRASEQAPELRPVAEVYTQCVKDPTRRAALRKTG